MFRGFDIHQFRVLLVLLIVIFAGFAFLSWNQSTPLELRSSPHSTAVTASAPVAEPSRPSEIQPTSPPPPMATVIATVAPTATPVPMGLTESGQIDINKADVATLMMLPGIGEKRAIDILETRTLFGGFRQPQDLLKVKGIGEKTYEKLQSLIIVQGYTGPSELPVAAPVSTGGRIRINHVTAKELEQLNGVGEVLAQRIIDFRTQYGPFRNGNDLMKVNGIGSKTLMDNLHLISFQ